MLIRKSIAAALMTVVIAAPAVAAENGAWPAFRSNSDGWQRLAQADVAPEEAPPLKKFRKAPAGEAAPGDATEGDEPASTPGQKKVRKGAPQQAPAAAEGGAPAGAPAQKRVRKTDAEQPAPGAPAAEEAPAQQPNQKRVRKGGPQQPPDATEFETRQADPLRRVRRNSPAGPDVVVEPDGPLGEPLPPRRIRKKGPEIVIETPSSDQILRKLEAPVRMAPRRNERVTIREFKRRPELRRAAPSIDIQSINFEFGSAEIPSSQYRKVEIIANALDRLLDRRPDSRVLIEGHTDAVGSDYSNQRLSEARAASLKRMLVREFGMPPYALETVGYGEEYLLVPTSDEEWQNRRVTLRRIDDFVQ